MKNNILISIALCAMASVPAMAQNLNPTVEVSKEYEGKPSNINKPTVKMDVPDSLLQLNLDFDYAVFDSPYKGSYDFKPYQVLMKPQSTGNGANKAYVRLGAGYSLHPDVEAVFTPEFSSPYHMSFYLNHNSYFGNYRDVFLNKAGSLYELTTDKELTHKGYDMVNKLGFDGGYDWKKAKLTFGVGYYGIATKDTIMTRWFNALDLNARVKGTSNKESYFYYDAGVRYRYFGDTFTNDDALKGSEFRFDGTFGPVIDSYNRVLVDVDANIASYSSYFNSHVGILALTPRYQLDRNRFHTSLGVRLEAMIKDDTTENVELANHQTSSQIVYPAVYVGYEAITDHLTLYAKATGRGDINTYSSIISGYHWFNPTFNEGYSPLLDNSIEKVNITAGFKGNIASRFQFDINGGYSSIRNGLLDMVMADKVWVSATDLSAVILVGGMPGIAYKDYNMIHADFDFLWKSKDVEIGGNLSYKKTNLDNENYYQSVFEPAPFSGSFRFIYNWNSRIFFGILAQGASNRYGGVSVDGDSSTTLFKTKIPGYVDLCTSLEYKYTQKLGFWIAGGNLLNTPIMRHPLYTESGIYGTVGITLSF